MTSDQNWSPEYRDALRKKIPPAKWAAMTVEEQASALQAENNSVKAGWGCVGMIVVLLVLGSLFGGGSDSGRAPTGDQHNARIDRDPPVGTNSERVLRDAGVDADAYMLEARELGLSPSEAVAAGVILCSETGDCPRGMTQSEAQAIRQRLER